MSADKPHHRTGKAPGNKGKNYPPTLLSQEDVQALLDGCGEGLLGLRGRAMIGLLYRTGVTISELISIRLEHVRLDADVPYIEVQHGKASRRLALDDAAQALLLPWWRVRPSLTGEHVICALEGPTKGTQLSPPSVRRVLNIASAAAGIAELRVHPHAFRYSLFAELVIEQWPLQYIQAQFGLTSIRAFEVFFAYLRVVRPPDEEIMEIIQTRIWEPRIPNDDGPQHEQLTL